MSLAAAVDVFFAATPTEVPAPGTVSAGLAGGVFFVAMALGSVLLWRNMNGKLKKLDAARREASESRNVD
jgi:uncharacterized transporter YbjL